MSDCAKANENLMDAAAEATFLVRRIINAAQFMSPHYKRETITDARVMLLKVTVMLDGAEKALREEPEVVA